MKKQHSHTLPATITTTSSKKTSQKKDSLIKESDIFPQKEFRGLTPQSVGQVGVYWRGLVLRLYLISRMCCESLVFRVPSRVFVKFACLTQLHVEQTGVCDVASGPFDVGLRRSVVRINFNRHQICWFMVHKVYSYKLNEKHRVGNQDSHKFTFENFHLGCRQTSNNQLKYHLNVFASSIDNLLLLLLTLFIPLLPNNSS